MKLTSAIKADIAMQFSLTSTAGKVHIWGPYMEPKRRTAMKHPSKTQHECDSGITFGLHIFRHLSSTRGGSRGSLDLLTSPLTEQMCVFLCENYPFKSCDCQIRKKPHPDQ